MKQFFTISFLILSLVSTAQTKLTFLQHGMALGIDKIKIERFSNQKAITFQAQDSLTIKIEDKFADLYTIQFYSPTQLMYKFYGWLDTGNVKLIISKAKYTEISVDTIINSPITILAKKFSDSLVELSHEPDSVKINELMLSTYKKNFLNPFSFYVGELYFDFNKNNPSKYKPLIDLENAQPKDIKKGLFYSIMMRRRFSYTEQHFFDYFIKTSFVSLFSESKAIAFESTKANLLVFLGEPTSESNNQFKDFNEKFKRIDINVFNVVVAIDQRYINAWKSKIKNNGLSIIVVPTEEFMQKTTFLPVTKFYYINTSRRISGYYDTMDEILKEAGIK